MITLFIDTHSSRLLIGLLKDDKVVDKISKEERSHSEHIMPSIEALLESNNIDVKDINKIIVVNGPGSFTGVRLGVTIAKTLAFTLKAEICPISSLEAYGESSEEDYDLICLKDTKGVYSAKKENNKYIDFEYRKNSDFEKYVKDNNYKTLFSDEIDLTKVNEYAKKIESVNAHSVNPLYVKLIDAEK